ncbi:Serine/threonine-protein kinase EDR1 [Camellia lanceoleosa]|uniref:Serine/threonine-protein kinase EDR1 n=1 Tax=Camellia lanceoleosa TaxID=1840588 RepID=A0ACC0HD16_9ERIC|nr:Serine/threonine-protein kinase EDR1 [Camellia lanceoleosa]
MPKMKHLLRKLHIGGGCNNGNHHPSQLQTAEVTPPLSSSSASLESTLMRIRAVESTENSVDFNFFEEEFQVQLALAISVSDPDSREDPEMVHIKDAKQISLGCVPSETLTESLSSVPMDHTNSKIGTDAPPSSTPNWTINISDVRTVKVSNISLATSEKDIEEFFSFSGDIQYVEMQRYPQAVWTLSESSGGLNGEESGGHVHVTCHGGGTGGPGEEDGVDDEGLIGGGLILVVEAIGEGSVGEAGEGRESGGDAAEAADGGGEGDGVAVAVSEKELGEL